MRRTGFTLIELLITLVVMTILLIIAVAVMRNGEANARDDTRKTDVTEIAQQLESYYTSGSNGSTIGQYPGLDVVPGNPVNESVTESTLRDLDWKALRAPGVPTTSPMSLIAATDTTTPASVPTQTSFTINQFVYQPLTSSGALCTTTATGCRKFNLYYKLENNPSVIQSITSKNQ